MKMTVVMLNCLENWFFSREPVDPIFQVMSDLFKLHPSGSSMIDLTNYQNNAHLVFFSNVLFLQFFHV